MGNQGQEPKKGKNGKMQWPTRVQQEGSEKWGGLHSHDDDYNAGDNMFILAFENF